MSQGLKENACIECEQEYVLYSSEACHNINLYLVK